MPCIVVTTCEITAPPRSASRGERSQHLIADLG